MTAIKLAPCPICGRTDGIVVEKSMYSREGKEIRDVEKRKLWIVKCEHDYAITEVSHSRIHAISRWNRGELNPMCETLQGPYTTVDEPWHELFTAIYKAAFDDYKAALRRKKETGGRGGIEGEHWLIKQSTAAKRYAREQIPYDQWRDKMDCRHCSVLESECAHKFGYLWIQFKNGTAPPCFRGHDKESEQTLVPRRTKDW